MKALECRDLGSDCDFKATGETVEEVLQKAGQHAAEAHGITSMPPELVAHATSLVKDA